MDAATQAATNGKPTGVKSASQLKTVDDLVKKFEATKRDRQARERQWKLNLAFYKGKQYSYFPRGSDRLDTLAVEDGEKPRHLVRLVSNQIITGAHSLLAQLTKTKPQLYASPGSGSDADIKAAQMAERLMEYWWGDMQLDAVLDEALLWSIIAGQGYWKIDWNPHASKQMRFMLDPMGKPILDDAMKTIFAAQLEQQGIPVQEKVVYLGDIRVEAMSPFDVYLDPVAKVFEDCKWCILTHSLDPDEIKSRWGVDILPNAVPTDQDSITSYSGTEGGGEPSVRKIFCGYFLPSPVQPKGRYVVWIDGEDKKILEDKPFETSTLPLAKFPGLRIPGSVYDEAPTTHAVPLNKELNRTISQIVEHKNLTINPVMMVPIGSLRTRRTNEPGQVLEYSPVGDREPKFAEVPGIPAYVFDHLANISARIKEVFFSVDVLEGKVPPNVEAGIAIDLLQEMATDRIAPIVKLIELALARAGQIMLSLAQKNYIEPRLLKIKGSGGSTQVKKFTKSDIDSGVSISAKVGSGLPRTRAGQQAQIERLVNLGIMTPERAQKHLDLGSMKSLQAKFQSDEDAAYRSIDKMLKQEILNPENVKKAQQAIQQGTNPETGQKLSGDPQEAQWLLFRASLTPQMYEDTSTHIEILSLFMNGLEFEALPEEVRQWFVTRLEILYEWFYKLPRPDQHASKINTQIKTTVGPTALSKILQKAGISASPEDTSEPPLETWVSDSVDKPDADATGPGQEGNNLAQAAQTMLTASLADAEAKHAAALKQQSHDQSMTHTQAMHEAQLSKAQAEAKTAEKKAVQSDFTKSKPTKGK